MKKSIHPECFEITAKCACGNKFKTVSTKKEIDIDICSSCHPFFTGTQKFVDTAGRIEKFKKRYAKETTTKPAKKKAVKSKTTTKKK